MVLTRSSFIALSLALAGCSGGGSPESAPAGDAPASEAQAGDLQPGDIPVQLAGTLQFVSEEQHEEGTEEQGMRYSRHFSAQCDFKQPAVMWTNTDTKRVEFRLSEAEPGVLKSEFTGGAEATGDSRLADLIHKPSVLETSTVRLRGSLTQCLIRRLDPAEFGAAAIQGHDITLEFQVLLDGTATTRHSSSDGVTQNTQSGGHALTLVLAPEPGEQGGAPQFMLVNDPSNIGAHLHASPLQMRPTLGERPGNGDDSEIKLKQDVYDGLAKHPESAWLGLVFDPDKKLWTYSGSHVTAAGAKHSLQVRIQVVSEPPR